jgi:excisionase family DNA binding protein
MNKNQAASFLQVSTRAIERYTAKGKLTPNYDRDESGRMVALYDEAQLASLKVAMQAAPMSQRAGVQREKSKPQGQALTLRGAGKSAALAELIAAIDEARSKRAPVVALESKLVLSLAESAAVSGLSAGHLREAIHSKKLKARKGIGRGWRIKRTDLDAYVRKL